ncbi:hypothetical protein HDK90DRAFT_334719 [Phyllosticta capitalensis]|uniref:BTB domain-containing protein n=2 Tax=Phyllosticta capitalensis TaxID=121624 RepID=A0ABR1YJN5_9PEZI
MDAADRLVPLIPLTAGLGELLESGLYSDLRICCSDGSVFNVHKMVICAQSAFFKSAIDPCGTNHPTTLTLGNDDPVAVKALIEYLYKFNYTVVHENDRGALFLFHIKVCAIGEAYGIRALRDLARDRAKIVFENSPTLNELKIPQAIRTIYDMDVATDSGLRDLIVDLSKANVDDLLEMGAFS